MSELIKVRKGDETLKVHPSTLAAHKAAGWVVDGTPDKPDAKPVAPTPKPAPAPEPAKPVTPAPTPAPAPKPATPPAGPAPKSDAAK